jgi:hypothetical protein
MRTRYLKRGLIFFIFASIGLIGMSLATGGNLLQWILTWHIFHLFSLSTIVLLLVFELAWWLERKLQEDIHYQKIVTFLLIISLILVLTTFLFFHDYSMTRKVGDPVAFELLAIVEHVLLDSGTCPIFPFLSFFLAGALTASILNLPLAQRSKIQKKALLLISSGILVTIAGFFFLDIEGFVSPAVLYPASSSLVLITNGVLVLVTTVMILLLDINKVYTRRISDVPKLVVPLVLVSKITLTVYFVHNFAFILPPSILPTETMAIVVAILYALSFYVLAIIWSKWKFMYSFEWTIGKLQGARWRSRVKKKVKTPVT